MKSRRGNRPGAPRRQRGVVLFIVMIVIVAMSLAAISLFRSVDTNILIAGNLAFKQTTILGTDAGIQNAINTLSGYNLENAGQAGYSPNDQTWDYTATDPTVADFDWTNCLGAGSCAQTTDGVGNTVLWTAHRLCSAAGNALSVDCVRGTVGGSSGGLEGSSKGNAGTGNSFARDTQVYYRVTARVTGPRNTISYAQAMLK